MKILAASALLLLASSALAAGPSAIAGKWAVHASIVGNESDRTCTFIQTDAKLTGSCTSDDKVAPLTGTVDGNKVTWKYDADYNGSTITLTYTATLDAADKFKGSIDVAPFGVTGDFTATRASDSAK